jgi:hypothetical protein
MTLAIFTDVHVRWQLVVGLRLRQVDILTAQEDGSGRLPDPQLMDRAGRQLDGWIFARFKVAIAQTSGRITWQ